MLPSKKAYVFYSCPVRLLKMGKYIISEPLAIFLTNLSHTKQLGPREIHLRNLY